MMSKEDVTVTQMFLQFMSERNLGVQTMHEIQISYMNENNVESNTYN